MYFMVVRMPLGQSRATLIGGNFVLQSDRWATAGGAQASSVRYAFQVPD